MRRTRHNELRPVSVKSMGDEDADPKYYKKLQQLRTQGSPRRITIGRNALVKNRLVLHSQNDTTAA